MTSNVCVSGVKLWSFPTLMWSSLDSCSLSSQSKMCTKFAKIPSLTYWEPKKHRGLPQRSRWRFNNIWRWITKQRPSWELHIWAGKLQSLTPETHTFDVIWKHVLCASAFTGRCNRRYIILFLKASDGAAVPEATDCQSVTASVVETPSVGRRGRRGKGRKGVITKETTQVMVTDIK